MAAFSRTNRLIAIKHDWLLLLEPTNQRQNPAENPQLLNSAERSQWSRSAEQTA